MKNIVSQNQQFLTFWLNTELYAFAVTHVIEVLSEQGITFVPLSPEFVNGIINFRGGIVGVVETRKKLIMNDRDLSLGYNLIVMDITVGHENVRLGALVDKVSDVIEVAEDQIMPLPQNGFKYNPQFLIGTYNSNIGFVNLLNANVLFMADSYISAIGGLI